MITLNDILPYDDARKAFDAIDSDIASLVVFVALHELLRSALVEQRYADADYTLRGLVKGLTNRDIDATAYTAARTKLSALTNLP